MRVLLVEDDALLSDAVSRAFSQSGHAVDVVASGEEADRALIAGEYELVLLDVGLPQLDGLEVLKRLRARRKTVPVLIMTAHDALDDRIVGLDLGADDYITKPFHLAELEARARALMRRARHAASSDIQHGRVRFDTSGRRLYVDDQPLDLTARELAVAELLLLRAGKIVTKQQIIDHLYGWEEVPAGNPVEAFIYRLRKKLEPSGMDIRTIRGMGYLIEKPHAA